MKTFRGSTLEMVWVWAKIAYWNHASKWKHWSSSHLHDWPNYFWWTRFHTIVYFVAIVCLQFDSFRYCLFDKESWKYETYRWNGRMLNMQLGILWLYSSQQLRNIVGIFNKIMRIFGVTFRMFSLHWNQLKVHQKLIEHEFKLPKLKIII